MILGVESFFQYNKLINNLLYYVYTEISKSITYYDTYIIIKICFAEYYR